MTSGDNYNLTFNPTSSDEDNHNLDVFEVWVNPLVTIESNGNTPVSYSVSSTLLTINGVKVPAADIIGVPALTMEASATGVTTVPGDLLRPIPTGQENQFDGPAFIPGLGAICANNALYQAQLKEDRTNPANPAKICTGANQCGCTPADFAGILETNPLLRYDAATFTANPYSGWESPVLANNSPDSICGLNTVPNTPSNPADCRYVPVPLPNTNSTPSDYAVPLYYLMEGGIQSPSHMYDDGTTSAEIISGSTITTVTLGWSAGIVKGQEQWQWTDLHSIGNANSIANSMSVTLSSSNEACDEEVEFYEDTVFHTFVFYVPPASQTNCY
jgi:hypothetical protein